MAKIHQFPQHVTYSKNSHRPRSWAQCGLLHSNPEARSGRSGRWPDAENRAGQHYRSWRSQEMPGKKKERFENEGKILWKTSCTLCASITLNCVCNGGILYSPNDKQTKKSFHTFFIWKNRSNFKCELRQFPWVLSYMEMHTR